MQYRFHIQKVYTAQFTITIYLQNTVKVIYGRFAPSSVRPWTFRPQDVSPPGARVLTE